MYKTKDRNLFTVMLSDEEAAKLNAIAKMRSSTKAAAIRSIIEDAYKVELYKQQHNIEDY